MEKEYYINIETDGVITRVFKRTNKTGEQIQTMLDQMQFMIWLIIVLGVIICIAACGAFYRMFADEFSMLITAAIFPVSYAVSIALTAVSYFVSLFLVKRKVAKVDMIESLKDNRE